MNRKKFIHALGKMCRYVDEYSIYNWEDECNEKLIVVIGENASRITEPVESGGMTEEIDSDEDSSEDGCSEASTTSVAPNVSPSDENNYNTLVEKDLLIGDVPDDDITDISSNTSNQEKGDQSSEENEDFDHVGFSESFSPLVFFFRKLLTQPCST